MNFLGAEINYGGRVTDDKDKILICAILLKYMNKEILEDGYKFSGKILWFLLLYSLLFINLFLF